MATSRARSAQAAATNPPWSITNREPDMGKHHGHDAEAVTVPFLLERAKQQGDALRIAWPTDHLDEAAGRALPQAQDEYPTAVLPRVPIAPTADCAVPMEATHDPKA